MNLEDPKIIQTRITRVKTQRKQKRRRREEKRQEIKPNRLGTCSLEVCCWRVPVIGHQYNSSLSIVPAALFFPLEMWVSLPVMHPPLSGLSSISCPVGTERFCLSPVLSYYGTLLSFIKQIT